VWLGLRNPDVVLKDPDAEGMGEIQVRFLPNGLWLQQGEDRIFFCAEQVEQLILREIDRRCASDAAGGK
jgi:hypothetical protein